MPRTARIVLDDTIYHVLNRGNDRARIFRDAADFGRFEGLVVDARARADVRIFAYCLMPNHWHMIVRPTKGPDLAEFVGRVSQGHAQWLRVRDGTIGEGHVYQGPYHALPVVGDDHFLTACRYVERNPLEAGRVARAEHWRWSSLGRRLRHRGEGLLDPWPVPVPREWLAVVNSRE